MNKRTWEEAVLWLIEQPDQQDFVRACYYDPPLHAAADRYWKSDEWQAIREMLPSKKGLALDIGAGNGIASYALASDGWDVVSLEPDPSEVVGANAIQKLASERKLPISVLQETAEQISLPDDHVDLIIARQVIHHAADMDKLCREAYRVLRPGGIFVAIREHVISSEKDLDIFLENHLLHNLYGGEHAYTLRTYTNTIKNAGFKLMKAIRPFDSVINFAPHTIHTLQKELSSRLSRFPMGKHLAVIVKRGMIFTIILNLLSILDQRPGRLFTFVAKKNE